MAIPRRALWVGVGLLVLACGAAAVFLLRPGDPEGLVADPTLLDFGALPHGQRETKTFRLRNRSARTITVGHVGGNCSCLQVRSSYATRLGPGEETEVTVDLVSGNVPPGTLQGKAVHVPNDPGGLLVVPVKAVLEEVVRFSPKKRSLDFGTVVAGMEPAPTRTLEVRGGEGYRTRVVRADATPAEVFETRRVEAEGGADVVVAVRPGAKGVGHVRGSLQLGLEVSGKRMETRRDDVSVGITLEWK
jgi:hypothetical protein